MLGRNILERHALDVDEAFADNNARDPNALFDMVDRHAVQVEFPPTS